MSRRILYVVSVFVALFASFAISSASLVYAQNSVVVPNSNNEPMGTASLSIDDLRVYDIAQTSAKVSWSTSRATNSKVQYGVTIGAYDHVSTTMCDNNTRSYNYVTEHCVILTGMSPGTLYNFEVNSVDEQQNGVTETSSFTTLATEDDSTVTDMGDTFGTEVATPLPSPSSPEITTGTIFGTVYDQFGGAIERAHVQIFPKQSAGTSATSVTNVQDIYTNEKGEYSLMVEKGEWVVSLIITSTTSYTSATPSAEVSVFADKTTEQNFTVSVRDAVVSGEVHSTDKILVDDFSGVAYAKRFDSNETYSVEVVNGVFTLGVSTGTYEISVAPYTGTKWVSRGSVTVKAVPGETQEVKLTVEQKTATISGFLVDSNGVPVIGTSYVVVASGEQGQRQEVLSDIETGEFSLSVASGIWFVQAHVANTNVMPLYRPSPVATRIELNPGRTVRNDITLERASGVIVGRVLSSNGGPATNVWVRVSKNTVSTTASGETESEADERIGVYTGSDGLFRFNVLPGTYFIRAYGGDSYNEVNPHERRIVVKADESVDVVLQFIQSETVLNGTVLRDGIGTRGYVTAWSELGGYRETHSDDNGAYSLNITPGDTWHVSASVRFDGYQYKSSVSYVNTGQFDSITRNISLERERMLPLPVTHQASATEARVLSVSDGAKVTLPAESISTTGTNTVTITPDAETPEQGDARVIGIGYDIQAFDNEGIGVTKLLDKISITIPYSSDELKELGITPKELTIAFWDEQVKVWRQLVTSVVNEEDKTVTATIDHLTRFAIVSAADIVPPNAPTSVQVSITGAQAGLSWSNPLTDFSHAKIYRATVQGDLGTMIATDITGNTYTDTLENGAMYYYTVRAVDPAGNESTNTDQVAASVTETKVTEIADRLRGSILLQVEANGEAWYIHPDRGTRYFLGRPQDAFEVMRTQGLGVSNANISTIPVGIKSLSGADDDGDGLSNLFEDAIGSDRTQSDTDKDTFDDKTEVINGFNVNGEGLVVIDRNLAKQVSGKILLQVERNGESWYVYPKDEKRYFLGRPHDAFTIMRELGLGITNADLSQIPIAPDSSPVQ